MEKEANQPPTHHFEEVSTDDKCHQIIVTTLEDLISVKRTKLGDDSYSTKHVAERQARASNRFSKFLCPDAIYSDELRIHNVSILSL